MADAEMIDKEIKISWYLNWMFPSFKHVANFGILTPT
jgi:hypothetical protein